MIVELDLSGMDSTCKCYPKHESMRMVLKGRRSLCKTLQAGVGFTVVKLQKYRHVFAKWKLSWSWCAGSGTRNLISFDKSSF